MLIVPATAARDSGATFLTDCTHPVAAGLHRSHHRGQVRYLVLHRELSPRAGTLAAFHRSFETAYNEFHHSRVACEARPQQRSHRRRRKKTVPVPTDFDAKHVTEAHDSLDGVFRGLLSKFLRFAERKLQTMHQDGRGGQGGSRVKEPNRSTFSVVEMTHWDTNEAGNNNKHPLVAAGRRYFPFSGDTPVFVLHGGQRGL